MRVFCAPSFVPSLTPQSPMSSLVTTADAILTELCAAHPLGYTPVLVWKNLRVTAGVAYYTKGVIGLSKLLLTDEERLRRTLVHEYAHLLAVVRHGRKAAGHGPTWRQAMLDLGAEPAVTHNYAAKRNVRRQAVTYRCKKCGAAIVRARRLPRRKKFLHAECGGAISLESVDRLVPSQVVESR